MKNKKSIIIAVIAAVVVAVSVTLGILYRNQIAEMLTALKEKIAPSKAQFTPEECEDFADI